MSEELNSWRNMYNTGKTSTKWKHWISQIDLKTCESCRNAPGRIVTGGEYGNYNEHLPAAPGRIWFEADLNYTTGKRNGHRILWSNDGLMFVTYNHYETFIEVIGG